VFGSQAASEYLPPLLNQGPRQTYDTIRTALRVHYELGMRTQGIAYNLANVFGGGCLEPKSPLTKAGQQLVEAIHKQRILLDVGGHTGEQTSFDALAISHGVPVVCTHTNVAALNPNPRATSDRLFEAIAKTGGMVGVTAISDFHMRSAASVARNEPRSPQATLEAHLDQYDYLKRLIGVDHIGLGTDFIWGWGNSYVHSSADNMVFPAEAMSDGPSQVVRDFENISKLGSLERGLSRRGWSQAELDKVLGANWLRVYRSVWGA
jgi:membrane dipeptidase